MSLDLPTWPNLEQLEYTERFCLWKHDIKFAWSALLVITSQLLKVMRQSNFSYQITTQTTSSLRSNNEAKTANTIKLRNVSFIIKLLLDWIGKSKKTNRQTGDKFLHLAYAKCI